MTAQLDLKPSKCNIVPVSRVFAMSTVEIIQDWLIREIPGWRRFNVIPAARYLGFLMGPAASSAQWATAAAKWRARAAAIARLGAAASTAARLYNTRAVPVLAYLCQISRPPPGTCERRKIGSE